MPEYLDLMGYRAGTYAAGASARAEAYLLQAQTLALRASTEPLPQRRAVLLESVRRLGSLAEFELRLAAQV